MIPLLGLNKGGLQLSEVGWREVIHDVWVTGQVGIKGARGSGKHPRRVRE
jgi:hypothetical protein